MNNSKIFHNKRNNQLTIILARRKLKFLQGKIPKSVHLKKLREADFEW